VIAAGAQREVLELAEEVDAPIASSLMGLSAIPGDHPRFLGMEGMHGRYASTMAMKNADCIIALGCRFNDRSTGDRNRFALKSKIIHIDIDGSELNKNLDSTLNLRGDLKETLKKLIPLLEQKSLPDWKKKIDCYKKFESENSDRRDGLTPKNLLNVLNRFLGENTAVATDVGQHQVWSAQNLSFKKCRRFVTSGGLGTMGFGLPASIGAAFGTGERSVLVTGDGSFGMSLHELATAVTHNVPIVIIIMNNGVLGMVRQWQTLFYKKHYSNTVLNRKSDFVKIAKAFGADGESVSDLNELESALERAFSYHGTYVLDCKIDKDEFVLPMLPPGGSMDEIILKTGE
jgi:acetolactate synthase-1/2/3 large subunit